jgi:hypothetical protein
MVDWPEDRPIPDDVWRPWVLFALPMRRDKEQRQNPAFFSTNRREDGTMHLDIDSVAFSIDLLENNIDALRTFPFDAFRLDFGVSLKSDADFTFAAGAGGEHVHVQAPRDTGEFSLVRLAYGLATTTSPFSGTVWLQTIFTITVTRAPTYYVIKGILPLSMIVFLTALAVHTEDVSQLGSRLSVIVAMFLTCFAIQWVILDRLPRVPYLTILDSIIFDAIGALGLMLVGACAAHKIAYPDGFFEQDGKDAAGGDRALAKRVDALVLGASVAVFAAHALYLTCWRRKRGQAAARGGYRARQNDTPCKDSVEQPGDGGTLRFDTTTAMGPFSSCVRPTELYEFCSQQHGDSIWRRKLGHPLSVDEY